MPMRRPSARKQKPTGSAASWGTVKEVTAMSPMEKDWPAWKVSRFGVKSPQAMPGAVRLVR